jgi:hypothetical protein
MEKVSVLNLEQANGFEVDAAVFIVEYVFHWRAQLLDNRNSLIGTPVSIPYIGSLLAS